MRLFNLHRNARAGSQNYLTSFDESRFHFSLVALALIALAAGGLLTSAKPAFTDAIPENGVLLQPAPTATQPSSTAGSNSGTKTSVSPVIGILVLLAPLVYMVWKSRGAKEPKITASACLPVIDENKRPFKIEEDEPAAKKPGTD